ncbi:MAG: HEAT repeat domain-containing protein [Gemmatimonadetes bacterium]|nr:HEAT repeat domain-containing protein [Gemmatimonadota bacterium]
MDAIVADMAPRPEVFSLGARSAFLHDLAARERERRGVPGAGAGPATHLYPRDKGWIRLDPTSTLDTVSLVDLAVLVESPVELADILMRLTGDEPSGPRSAESALEKKFSEVAKLFAALDPRLAAVMFARLAGAVLNLEPDRRKALLERTILPGLLDGKVDGQVLKDFPDVNLAESLCLLLDLETAAPEVLSTALDRLDLPNERRKVVVPLLDDHLDARRTGATSLPPVGAASSVDRRTYELIRVDATGGKAFADFMAFDLSMDGQAKAAVAGICEEVCTTDLSTVRLGCLWQLVRLEPNPGRVERLLARALAVVAEFERAGRWADLARWIVDERALADQLASARPDVASAIASSLDGFCTPARVRALAELHQGGGEAAEAAGALVRALGGALVPVSLALLDDPRAASLARPLVNLLDAHAVRLAPDLAVQAGQTGVTSGRAVARLLGLAGRGYEKTLAPLLASPDEETGREALRALVRIGTPQAAAMVVTQIQTTDPSMQAAAEEALAQFPAAVVRTKLRDLIGRRDFVVRHPDLGARLLAHAVRVGAVNLEPALRALAPLRFRFWNPPLVRVGRAARDLLAA